MAWWIAKRRTRSRVPDSAMSAGRGNEWDVRQCGQTTATIGSDADSPTGIER